MRLTRAGGLAALIVCAVVMLAQQDLRTQTIGSGGVSYALQVTDEVDYHALVNVLDHLHTDLSNRLAVGEDIVAIDFSSPGASAGGQRVYFGRVLLETNAVLATEIRFIYVYVGQTQLPECPPDRIKFFLRSVPRTSDPPIVASAPSFEYLLQVLQSPPPEVIDLLTQHQLVGLGATVTNNPPTGHVATLEFSSGPLSLPITLSVECMSGLPGQGACTGWDVTIQ